jgi:hypothetical protein
MRGSDKDAESVCVELEGQGGNGGFAEYNVTIRVRWIEGSLTEYYAFLSEIASQLAWCVATFQKPSMNGISFTKAKTALFTSPNVLH